MGRIYKRGRVWYYDVVLANGQRLRKSIGRVTKSEAQLVLKKVEGDIVLDKFELPKKKSAVTFNDIVPEYLDHCEVHNAKSTLKTKRHRIQYLVSFFGKCFLGSINNKLIDKYKQERCQLVTKASVNRELAILTNILRTAKEWRLIKSVPVIQKLPEAKKPPKFLSKDEISKLLDVLKDKKSYPVVLAALHTGMRKGELLNLQWSDIDMTNKTIAVQSKEGWQTKNRKFRQLNITDKLYSVLDAIESKEGKVFRVGATTLENHFNDLIEAMGFRINLHMLRHTFASHLAMEGVSLYVIKELLGHSNIETTMVYAHLTPDHAGKFVHKLPY